MKEKEVHVGHYYRVRVSGKIAVVRLDSESRYGGWDATNMSTLKRVRIKTAVKLRSEYYYKGLTAAIG